MLKGIHPLLSPELLKILMEMGHGDEIVIGDGNFPGARCAQRLIRMDGLRVPAVLDAVLSVMPLDGFVKEQVLLMRPGEKEQEPTIWKEYREMIERHGPVNHQIGQIERFAFYERAKKAYAVIATSEPSPYANMILVKGFVNSEYSLT